RELGVVLAGQARPDRALDRQDVLAAQLVGGVDQGRVRLLLEDDLGDAVAVAQVDEHLLVVSPAGVDPAVEHHGLADVRVPQFATGVGPPQRRHVRRILDEGREAHSVAVDYKRKTGPRRGRFKTDPPGARQTFRGWG